MMPTWKISAVRWTWMRVAVLVGMASAAWSGMALETQAIERILSRGEARRLGLDRAWFAQVELNPARHHVERAILIGDRLTVLTSAGVLHELDALSGETFWTSPVGNPDYPSLGPAANDKYVAVINGSTLYVLRREDGKPVLHRRVKGGPGAAPAVSQEYVFVPMISGWMEGYPLNQGERTYPFWSYTSYGRAMVTPLTTPNSVVWSTDRGRVYVAGILPPSVRFRLDTPSDIVASPAYLAPLVFAATMNGDLFGIDEKTGERKWKYATGYPIVRAPAAVGDSGLGSRVYVTSDEPALHAVDVKTGNAVWIAPNMKKFAAASRQRVYAIDDLDALAVLDAKTGALLDRMPTDGTADALVNDQTDRLYLFSDDGLLQCMYEIGAKKPLYHREQTAEAPTKPEPGPETGGATTREPAETTGDETDEMPGDDQAEEAVNPFGVFDDAEPSDEGDEPAPPDDSIFGVDEENPFGN